MSLLTFSAGQLAKVLCKQRCLYLFCVSRGKVSDADCRCCMFVHVCVRLRMPVCTHAVSTLLCDILAARLSAVQATLVSAACTATSPPVYLFPKYCRRHCCQIGRCFRGTAMCVCELNTCLAGIHVYTVEPLSNLTYLG
jgi:hypothetical protein